MGSTAREESVLKLVRPGRRLEVHKKPVTAEEVMRRYPRHSITRPDIFEFPWIVVKPDAVLVPGKVFFIVPNRTIYQLLKARAHGDHLPSSSLLEQKQSAEDRGHHHVSEHSSPPKDCAGMTRKHNEQRRRLKLQFFACASAIVSPSPSDEDADSDRRLQKDNQVELSSRNKKTRGESKQKPPIHPKNETRRRRKYDDGNKDIAAKFADLNIRESKQVPLLKSCMRKPESARKLLRLKVTLNLPNKEEEQQSEATDSGVQFQGLQSRLALQGIF
ncbi:hypothetical protein D8674_003122 [Pyrus ussuriensis x Pyrus communis]|uniref:Uncharacterized protein n=1 Tax=Pyrus ussuriensis x Pyrus communis TaxID=2448454 RepID=A0A5N5FGN7_9ROSA|nr:hypothetical protein D8674_003122 [Pyrus ussuriensis x Pyrus communis]